jgi:predicted AAA+ superfamily ATPase
MISKEIIERTVVSQQKLFHRLPGMVSRDLLPDIPLSVSHAVIVSGIRRCGKSTLLLQLTQKIKTVHYFNFDDSRIQGFDASDFNRLDTVLLEMKPETDYYFFDEIQLIDQWEVFVRTLLDRQKKVYITGSNASMLSRELGTRLTGRNLQYELFPFSFAEYLKFKNAKPEIASFERFFQEGGIPEFLMFPDIKVLQGLVSDILFRDIIVRHNIRNHEGLQALTNYLLSNVGKEFSYTKLKSAFGISSVNTIISFVKFLEDSYLLFAIPKFEYSLKKQAVNPKKNYAIDSGIINANTLSFTDDLGRILENIVFIQLKRQNFEIFYFKMKKECDFVVSKKGKIVMAIQVCYFFNDDNLQRELNGVVEAIKFFNLEKGLILTYNNTDEFIIDNKQIAVKPVWKWLLESE